MQVDEFRKNLLKKFTERKVFEKIRLDIRSYVIKELFEKQMYTPAQNKSNLSPNIIDIVNTLLVNHLQTMNLDLSCSVLVPEASISIQNPRQINEILSASLDVACPEEGTSFLYTMCEKTMKKTSEIATQTENALSFEDRLRSIEQKYKKTDNIFGGNYHSNVRHFQPKDAEVLEYSDKEQQFETFTHPNIAKEIEFGHKSQLSLQKDNVLEELVKLRQEMNSIQADIKTISSNPIPNLQIQRQFPHFFEENEFVPPKSNLGKSRDLKSFTDFFKNLEDKSSVLESKVKTFLYSVENSDDLYYDDNVSNKWDDKQGSTDFSQNSTLFSNKSDTKYSTLSPETITFSDHQEKEPHKHKDIKNLTQKEDSDFEINVGSEKVQNNSVSEEIQIPSSPKSSANPVENVNSFSISVSEISHVSEEQNDFW